MGDGCPGSCLLLLLLLLCPLVVDLLVDSIAYSGTNVGHEDAATTSSPCKASIARSRAVQASGLGIQKSENQSSSPTSSFSDGETVALRGKGTSAK